MYYIIVSNYIVHCYLYLQTTYIMSYVVYNILSTKKYGKLL